MKLTKQRNGPKDKANIYITTDPREIRRSGENEDHWKLPPGKM